jgi:CelD/BcsL family acetyltransferase involved in cellulose biosynthesis
MASSTAGRAGGRALGLRPAESLEALREPWTALGDRSGNIFSTWEWATTWWRHYGAERPLQLATLHDESDRPVAILPLYQAFRRPVRIARFVGHGAADQLGPVCAPTESGVIEALAGSGHELGWDVLLADRLPGDSGWGAAIGGKTLTHESSPVIDVAGLTWDDYLARRSSNFRSQVRRKERKLERDHGMTYRLSDGGPEQLSRDLDALFELHRARWREEGSGAFEDTREAFHRDFASVAAERGWLRLWLAEVDGKPIAAWYGFRFAGADWYYQFGRDPEWDRSSVGLVLLAHTVRDAIEAGQREYKLLRGGEGYKDRFATGDAGLDTIAAGRGPLGRSVVGAAAAGLSLPEPLRGRFVRAVG